MLLIIFRQVITKNIFPQLTKEHSYKLFRLVIILAWSISALGIFAWVYSSSMPREAHNTYKIVNILKNKEDKAVLVSEEPLQRSIFDVAESKNIEDFFKRYVEHVIKYISVDSGTKVEILDSDIKSIEYKDIPPALRLNSYKVRILEGEYSGRDVWVQASFLKTIKELQ